VLNDVQSPQRIPIIDRCIDNLEDARAAGPTSGAVLTRLGEQYEFENKFSQALEINLQVAMLYPRYYVARYRAAVGISMMVSSGIENWRELFATTGNQAERILTLINEIGSGGTRMRSIVNRLRDEDTNEADVVSEVSCLSASQLRSGIRLARFPAMTLMALRKNERRFWLARMRHPLLTRHNVGSTMPSIAKVGFRDRPNGQLPASCPESLFARPSTKTVERWVKSKNESAQVLYHLACFEALGPNENLLRAIELLESTQTHPYAEQNQASWMARDPDLIALHGNPRFERLVALLRGGTYARKEREN
jgi:hypothetical protein